MKVPGQEGKLSRVKGDTGFNSLVVGYFCQTATINFPARLLDSSIVWLLSSVWLFPGHSLAVRVERSEGICEVA